MGVLVGRSISVLFPPLVNSTIMTLEDLLFFEGFNTQGSIIRPVPVTSFTPETSSVKSPYFPARFSRMVEAPVLPASTAPDGRRMTRSARRISLSLEDQLRLRQLDPELGSSRASDELMAQADGLMESDSVSSVSAELVYNASRFERMDMAFERGASDALERAQLAAAPVSEQTSSTTETDSSSE